MFSSADKNPASAGKEFANFLKDGGILLFVPGEYEGISHNPREHTAPADLALGATVLLDVLLALADEA